MASSHPPDIVNSVGLASRMTSDEAAAFMRQFDWSIHFGQLTEENHGPVKICYVHRSTRRHYRVIATTFEMREEVNFADLFGWATLDETPETGDLYGRLLGSSGRADGLRACDLNRAADTEGAQSPVIDDLALVLCCPGEPLGILARFPKELRWKMYEHAFPRTFWQCYHTKLPGLTLLDITHSSRLPAILSASKVIREEVLDSAHSNRRLEIIVGTEVVAFNFPLVPGMRADQVLDDTQARRHASAELFIGVQVPSPRSAEDMAAVRVNVRRVVDLLNGIAAKQNIPPIRVSFRTNEETRSFLYYGSDFELLTPLSELRIANGIF